MSKTTSPSVGKPYGLERVCRVLDIPRSTIYAQKKRQAANVMPLHRARLKAEGVGCRSAGRHPGRSSGLSLYR
jgi:hypothetical protein